jgi:hypothetical protein
VIHRIARFMERVGLAFEMECHLYHHFEPADNAAHPERAAQGDWQCPLCAVFVPDPRAEPG